eukprot:550866-Amorphochlora_amoeboformis.AAC.1
MTGDRVELENKATSLVLSLPSDSGGVLSAMPESSRASSQSRGTVIEILHVDGMQDPKKELRQKERKEREKEWEGT